MILITQQIDIHQINQEHKMGVHQILIILEKKNQNSRKDQEGFERLL